MQLRTLKNGLRFAAWTLANYPEDWAYEIMNKYRDEPYPPYEFWLGIGHPCQRQFERMVGRGIACWIEQEHESLQDFVLDLLNNDFVNDADPDNDELFATVCLSIWAWMKPHDWLKRHAYDTGPKSQLWGRAILHVHYAIIWNEWDALRNFKAEFFIKEEAEIE